LMFRMEQKDNNFFQTAVLAGPGLPIFVLMSRSAPLFGWRSIDRERMSRNAIEKFKPTNSSRPQLPNTLTT
jgi:hypothetical protein